MLRSTLIMTVNAIEVLRHRRSTSGPEAGMAVIKSDPGCGRDTPRWTGKGSADTDALADPVDCGERKPGDVKRSSTRTALRSVSVKASAEPRNGSSAATSMCVAPPTDKC